MKCSACGADLKEGDTFCPVCGKPVNGPATAGNVQAPVEEKTAKDKLGLAGFIVAFCSWLIDPLALASLTAIILSIVGVTGAKGKYKTFAIIGICAGALEFVLQVIRLVNLFSQM